MTKVNVTVLDRDFSSTAEMLAALGLAESQIVTEKMAEEAKISVPYIARDSGGELNTQRWIWWGHAGLQAAGASFQKGDRVVWSEGHQHVLTPREQFQKWLFQRGPVPPMYSFVLGYGYPTNSGSSTR